MTRAEYDERLARLVGQRIETVWYHEVATDDRTPWWSTDNDAIDSLDFGVGLELSGGDHMTIDWGDDFVQYGVSIVPDGHGYLGNDHVQSWDVTERWRGKGLIASPIVTAAATWRRSEREGPPVYYPQDVRLRFGGGAVVVLATLEIEGTDVWSVADHITAFFDEAEVCRHFAEARGEL